MNLKIIGIFIIDGEIKVYFEKQVVLKDIIGIIKLESLYNVIELKKMSGKGLKPKNLIFFYLIVGDVTGIDSYFGWLLVISCLIIILVL